MLSRLQHPFNVHPAASSPSNNSIFVRLRLPLWPASAARQAGRQAGRVCEATTRRPSALFSPSIINNATVAAPNTQSNISNIIQYSLSTERASGASGSAVGLASSLLRLMLLKQPPSRRRRLLSDVTRHPTVTAHYGWMCACAGGTLTHKHTQLH